MGGVLDDGDGALVQEAVARHTLDHLLVRDAELRVVLQRAQHSVHVVRVDARARLAQGEGVLEERRALGQLQPGLSRKRLGRVQLLARGVQHEHVLPLHPFLLHARRRHEDAAAVADGDGAARARHPPQVIEGIAEVDDDVPRVRRAGPLEVGHVSRGLLSGARGETGGEGGRDVARRGHGEHYSDGPPCRDIRGGAGESHGGHLGVPVHVRGKHGHNNRGRAGGWQAVVDSRVDDDGIAVVEHKADPRVHTVAHVYEGAAARHNITRRRGKTMFQSEGSSILHCG